MTRCKYPGCTYEDNGRPYARKGLLSVTEAISFANLGDKARSFAWAASEIAATTAVHDFDFSIPAGDWAQCTKSHKVAPGLCKFCKLARSEFDRRWSAKAALGNHVHHLAVQWADGEDIVSDPVTDPFLDGLEQFYKDYEPEWHQLEATIAGDGYVGTFDAIATLKCPFTHTPFRQHCDWLIDIKTDSSKHQTEWELQLAAYRWATHITNWVEGKEQIAMPMPPVDHCGVLWLRDTGEAELIWLEVTDETHQRFLQLVELATWEKQQRKVKK